MNQELEKVRAEAEALAIELVQKLSNLAKTIVVAESLTGGLLAETLVTVPGASKVFYGGVVSYHSELKTSLLGVDAKLLQKSGAVDPEVARQMAAGVRERLAISSGAADFSLATTGVAGPDPQDSKAVGTVFIAFARHDSVELREFSFSGSRAEIRSQTVLAALKLALEQI